MGCYTWAYYRVKDTEMWDSEKERKYKLESFNDYIKYCQIEQIDVDPDDIMYIDENGDKIYYHLETYEQMVKRHEKLRDELNDVYELIQISDTFDDAARFFIENSSLIISNIEDGDVCVKDNCVYYQTFNNGYLGMNPFNVEGVKYFRVYGYPLDQEDEFYLTSPTGCRPEGGWTNAEDLIAFLEWYKNVSNCGEPVTYDENDEMIEGYTEVLYNNIREFFGHFPENDVLVKFS